MIPKVISKSFGIAPRVVRIKICGGAGTAAGARRSPAVGIGRSRDRRRLGDRAGWGTTSRGLRKNESQGCQSSVYEYLSCSSSRTAFRSENTPSKSDFTGTSAWISKIGRAVKRVGIQICVPARESDGVLADEPLCAWTVVTRPIKVQTCAVILPACELEGFAGGSAETYLG